MNNSKHVQTELSNEEYRHFRALAKERDLSLTAALREAAECWMEKQHQIDPDDPLFDILEQLDREPLPDKPQTNAATQDDLTDDWNGSTAGIQFYESENSEE